VLSVVLNHDLRDDMTLITFDDGKVVFRDGAVGTEQACCCGGEPCSGPCDNDNLCEPNCECKDPDTGAIAVSGECEQSPCENEFDCFYCPEGTWRARTHPNETAFPGANKLTGGCCPVGEYTYPTGSTVANPALFSCVDEPEAIGSCCDGICFHISECPP
jgi:hypothetical protein